MYVLQRIALVIIIIGAINWGLVGVFNFNLISFILDGISPVLSKLIYIIVGLAGIVSVSTLFIDFDHID